MTKYIHLWASKIILVLIFLLSYCSYSFANKKIQVNGWRIEYNDKTKKLDFLFNNDKILTGVYAKILVNSDTLASYQYNTATIDKKKITDSLGKGIQFTIRYVDTNLPQLQHIFTFYSEKEYFLTEAIIRSDNIVSSNYMSPLFSDDENMFLRQDNNNRGLSVPFDNDAFVNYLSSPLDGNYTSFEVSSIFNGADRNGIVVGSVEHDVWKTGIKYVGKNNYIVSKLECYGGITHELTRDISNKPNRPSCEHGSIKGREVKSPKILFGYFLDWRKGMEKFGEVNAKIAPPRPWDKGTPFGWNSWAAMAEKVNYKESIEVADFIKKELQPNSFENDGVVYIGLDSYWSNFSDKELKAFVNHVNSNGQIAGIYWCPFSDWFGNKEAYVEGTGKQYRYKDIYLYAEGKPRKIESLAVDPTHPGTKKRIEHYIGLFKDLGFKYIKLDFINNGTLEADSFYNANVTTGVQAYNEGMKCITEVAGDDLFLALSIAPTFPAQYGNSKRISCDAWGAMNEEPWGSTGYMLNSLSFGWWLDRVYPFNDADHILLHKPTDIDNYKEGANRARITSAVITGIYMLGDNFSLNGNEEARAKARMVATNTEINALARNKYSFYPVEGYLAKPNKSENFFMYDDTNCSYVAIFNFGYEVMTGNLLFSRLGLKSKNINTIKEIWTDKLITNNDIFLPYSIPPQDVRVYKIIKNQ